MFRSLSILSAGVVVLAMAGNAKADDDLVRLDGKGGAEVQETRYYYGGGYRGGYGGYRGGYGYGRGYYGGGYGRGYYGGGWGGGYYGGGWGRGYGLGIGLGYGSYYGGGYNGGYYSSPSYYYSQPSYYYAPSPCTCAAPDLGSTTLTLARPVTPQMPGDGTFPYDGGPRDGFLAPAPAGMQYRPNVPRQGVLVSVPTSGYQFLAFGEQPSEPAQQQLVPNAAESLRVSYPGYGEPMPNLSGFSGGTMDYRIALR